MGVVPILELPPSLSVTDIQLIILRLGIIQSVASGCCDLIAQCIMVCINHCTYLNPPFYSPSKSSKIYLCWIVWDKNVRLVIIPSFMAIAYIGSVNLSSSDKPTSIVASSYLARVRLPIDKQTHYYRCGNIY